MKENELKDAALDTKDFLTDDLKEEMRTELKKTAKDLIYKNTKYVAGMLELPIDKRGILTCNGTELVQFLTLMSVACDCEIKIIEKFKRKLERDIKRITSKAADKDLNRKLS